MYAEFCKTCVHTLKSQGSVLVPILPTGKLYELIERLQHYLGNEASPVSSTPIYVISRSAKQSLAYANIYAEWVCAERQAAVYAADPPFEQLNSDKVRVHASLADARLNEQWRQPCVVFASHPSLRFGDACHLVELWKGAPNNAFVFVEPEFSHVEALAPYQPVYASAYYFPVDASLHTSELHALIGQARTVEHLTVPAELAKSIESQVSASHTIYT